MAHALAARCRAARPQADACARILDRTALDGSSPPLSPASPACATALADAFFDRRPMAFTHVPKAGGARPLKVAGLCCLPLRARHEVYYLVDDMKELLDLGPGGEQWRHERARDAGGPRAARRLLGEMAQLGEVDARRDADEKAHPRGRGVGGGLQRRLGQRCRRRVERR